MTLKLPAPMIQSWHAAADPAGFLIKKLGNKLKKIQIKYEMTELQSSYFEKNRHEV